ncbi:exported protein of unknown function [Stenotrophomonas maltophilia]|nr:exported protein of unknown function [Stenotrophomonas maltophilia]
MARSPWGTSPKRSTCRSLWSAITCGCCAVRASCAANAKPSTSSTASRTSTSARCCRTWRSTFPRTKPTTDQAQAPRRMAGCEAPVPTPPVSLKDVLDAAWAQHPESRALPGRRDAAQAQQWAAAAWTPEPPALAITHKTDRFNRTTALVSWMSEWPQRRRGVFPPPCPCSLPARATQRA